MDKKQMDEKRIGRKALDQNRLDENWAHAINTRCIPNNTWRICIDK